MAAFDSAHLEDENRVTEAGRETTRALRYHERLTFWVKVLSQRPSEALLLASRCQHLRRGAVPRRDYPEGRRGYLRWRTALAERHALEAGRILADCGYSSEMVERVGDLLLKKGLKSDPEVQLFEDAICLVFIEEELTSFVARHEEAKVIRVLAKTWRKMSERGREQGLRLTDRLPREVRELVKRAISRDPRSVIRDRERARRTKVSSPGS